MTHFDLRVGYINAGYSRRSFSREIDVPEQSIRRLEGGDPISPRYAKRIADYFGVKVTDLMPLDDIPSTDSDSTPTAA